MHLNALPSYGCESLVLMNLEKASSAFRIAVERLGFLEDFFWFLLRDGVIRFYSKVEYVDRAHEFLQVVELDRMYVIHDVLIYRIPPPS